MHESHKLQALGCDVGQGYLYAKPMAKAQLIGTMRRRLVGGAAAGSDAGAPADGTDPRASARAEPRAPFTLVTSAIPHL